jgi:phosphatidylglycerol:prolipoprotein diacylglycerol transferase
MSALVYPTLMLLGILLAAHLWERGRLAAGGGRLELVFIGGLFGMVIGSKLGFILAEGLWTLPPAQWLVQGKTITGGLLGAYVAVELAKRAIGHREPTGDLFALTVPASLMLGRIGCVAQGCCLGVAIDAGWYALVDQHGVSRWPAAIVELLFNALMLAGFYVWHRLHADPTRPNRLRGQLFHVYLIAYGLFRLVHEHLRDTPRLWAGITGYQVLAAALLLLGIARFVQRDRLRGAGEKKSTETLDSSVAGRT